MAVDINHMIEPINRLETEHERRVPVVFQHDSREQHSLETVRAPMMDDAAEAPQRRASVRLGVVWKIVEVALNRKRRAQIRHEPALTSGEFDHLVMWSSGHWLQANAQITR